MCATLGDQQAQTWCPGDGEQDVLQVDATVEGPGSWVPVVCMENTPGRSVLFAGTPLCYATGGPSLPGHVCMCHGCTVRRLYFAKRLKVPEICIFCT